MKLYVVFAATLKPCTNAQLQESKAMQDSTMERRPDADVVIL